MSKIKPCVLAALLLAMAGCVESLQPLYTSSDLIYDPALIGVWTSGLGQQSLAFTHGGGSAYRLVCTDQWGKSDSFQACLFKLKDVEFMDVYPDGTDLTQNDFYKGHLIPAHSFLRVDQIGPTLRLSDMDYHWTRQYLDQHPDALAYALIGPDHNGLVLTATTQHLQQFVLAHLNDKGFFKPIEELHRRQPTTRP